MSCMCTGSVPSPVSPSEFSKGNCFRLTRIHHVHTYVHILCMGTSLYLVLRLYVSALILKSSLQPYCMCMPFIGVIFFSCSVASGSNTSGGESGDGGGGGSSKQAGSALVQWTEVPLFPGMVCSLSQSTSTPVVMFFKPDVILVHELRALSSKSKVRHSV